MENIISDRRKPFKKYLITGKIEDYLGHKDVATNKLHDYLPHLYDR
jgi:hypothetical protein